jgi:hypothetical protein
MRAHAPFITLFPANVNALTALTALTASIFHFEAGESGKQESRKGFQRR